MSLSYRRQRQLRLIEAGLCRTDPHLAAIMGMFGRLYPDHGLPAWEHPLAVPSGQGYLRRTAACVLAVLAATIVAISILPSQVAGTTVGRRTRTWVLAADYEQTHAGRETDGRGRPDGR
jgi:hypothetical protein